MNKLIVFVFMAALIVLPTPKAAAGDLWLAELTLPSRPTPPTPPSIGRLKEDPPAQSATTKKQSTAEPRSDQAPAATRQQTTDTPPLLPKNTTTVTPKRETAETAPPPKTQAEVPPTITPPQQILIPDAAENATEAKPPAPPPETWQERWRTPASKKIIYTVLAALLSAGTAYFYLTTPRDTATPTTTAANTQTRRSKQPDSIAPKPKSSPPAKPKQPPREAPPLAIESKIKNTSLLEQLIKYDMENYGELRSNLDYEQPAYVEKLIRKYGGDDKNKINRAINLFYISRNNK